MSCNFVNTSTFKNHQPNRNVGLVINIIPLSCISINIWLGSQINVNFSKYFISFEIQLL